MLDPRPLEPDWVALTELSDTAEWTVVRHKWNKETRKYDQIKSYGEGNMTALLKVVVDIINSEDPECLIEINAENICPTLMVSSKTASYNLKYENDGLLHWSISPADVIEEEGNDLDELIGSIEYMSEKQMKFKIELSFHDPTPEYMEIGTMF
jgi:hypothetical protein